MIEKEGIGTFVNGGGGQRCCYSTIDDYQTRATADVPTAAAIEVVKGFVIHHEERVAKFLNSCLEFISGGGGLVIAADLFIIANHCAIACLATNDGTTFRDGWEEEDSLGFLA